MLTTILAALFKRDLLKLKSEIESYKDEATFGRLKKTLPTRQAIYAFT